MRTRASKTRPPATIQIAMPVDVQYAVDAPGVPRKDSIVEWAEAVITSARSGSNGGTDLCVRLVDTDESRQLNASYRNANKATNVLSFPAGLNLPGCDVDVLGDVVICAPLVAIEAQQQHKSVADHYAHLVVHGVLHLCGFDHEDPAEADFMEGLEREILGRLGVADPYRER